MMFIYFCTAVIASGWLYTQIKEKQFTIKLHWMYIPFAIFLLSQVLATFFSIDVHTSIFGYYGRFNGGLFSIACYLILLFVFIQISDKKHLLQCLTFAFYTAVGVVLWGLPGKFGLDLSCLVFTGKLTNACWSDQFRPAERMFSTLGQPNWLGAYLVIAFFIGIGLYAYKKDKIFTIPSWIVISAGQVLLFLGLLATRSRSSMLALAVSIVVTVILVGLRKKNILVEHWKKIATVAVCFVIAILVFKTGIDRIDRFISLPKQQEELKQTISSPEQSAVPATNVTESFDIRKIVWKGAIDLSKQYPIFGTGTETFAYAYYFTRPVEHNYTSEWDFLYNKAHNEFLNYLSTTGYVGLISYLIMILAVVAYAGIAVFKKRLGKQTYLIIGLVTAYISISITNFFGFSISVVQLFFYLIPAVLLVLLTEEFKVKSFSVAYGSIFEKAAKGAVLLIFCLWSIYLVRYYMADVYYAEADTLQRSGQYQAAFSRYENALKLRYEHVYEDKMSSTLANLAFISSYQDDKALSTQLRHVSEYFNEKTLVASPLNVLYWKTKAKNQYMFYQTTLDIKDLNEAIKNMNKAESLAPTDAKIPYTTALFYSLASDEAKDPEKKQELKKQAVDAINRSLKLKNNYEDAKVLLKQLQLGNNET